MGKAHARTSRRRTTLFCALRFLSNLMTILLGPQTAFDTDRCLPQYPFDWSGRAMARSGLRMMPTFPLPSLKFRTADFPQYGFKAGFSDRACPCDTAHVSLGLGRGPGGQHLFKRGPYQWILLELAFDGRMRSQVGQRIYRFASYRDLIGLAFAEVCELKGIVNVLQLYVFLHRLREELALMRELGHCIRFDSFVDDLFMLANQLAKFCKNGIVHFRYPSEG